MAYGPEPERSLTANYKFAKADAVEKRTQAAATHRPTNQTMATKKRPRLAYSSKAKNVGSCTHLPAAAAFADSASRMSHGSLVVRSQIIGNPRQRSLKIGKINSVAARDDLPGRI
jgi:hypothetical protein